tara:strand:+ start:16304 stop:16546 length:243 start_codon:yes stop_codon:yes gene_type:complete
LWYDEYINEVPMDDEALEEVIVNFSKRQITLISDEGDNKIIKWKWDDEGSQGFAETVDLIKQVLPYGVEVTYIVEEAVIQ